MQKLTWLGTETPADFFLALVRGPVGVMPASEASCGASSEDGLFKFRDRTGKIVAAESGDHVCVWEDGWTLEKATPT